MATLSTPIVSVVLEPAAGGELTETTIQTDNRDMVAFDLHRSRAGWPKLADAPILWMTFLAWHALKRSGELSESFDDFNGRCLAVKMLDEDGNEVQPGQEPAGVDPTQPARALG